MTEQSPNSPLGEKIISGKSSNSIPPLEKIISGKGKGPDNTSHPVATAIPTDLTSFISYSTQQGGLNSVPADFANKDGSWTTIHSDNPFEVLYLDFKQYPSISDEIVEKNYKCLSEFWAQTLLKMNRGARDQIEKKYTSQIVNEAGKKLEIAFRKLKTKESRELYFKEINNKRIQAGLASIETLIELSIEKEFITEKEVERIVGTGKKNNLEEYEIVSYIISVIKSKGFKERAEHISAENPFKNLWMTDKAWEATRVEWLGEYAVSLEQVGRITFREKKKSEYYLRDTNFLPPLINRLTNSSTRTREFQEIIEQERDLEKRYLKILYHLNPALPFRFEGKEYMHIQELFSDACKTSKSFYQAYEVYSKGYLNIWMKEALPEWSSILPIDCNYQNFLRILYAINNDFPFYLKDIKYNTPEALIDDARKNRTIWNLIYEQIQKEHLLTWFICIGRGDINTSYSEHLKIIRSSELYNQSELPFAAVQALILTVNKNLKNPKLAANVTEIKKLDIEGNGLVRLPFNLKLANEGYVKSKISLSITTEGITLNQTTSEFDSLTNKNEQPIFIQFNTLQLIKDKVYTFNLIVKSVYQSIIIPVQFKIVFPKNAYRLKLLQYSLIGGGYLGIFRFLLGFILGHEGWLAENPFIISRSPILSFLLLAFFLLFGHLLYKKTREYENV